MTTSDTVLQELVEKMKCDICGDYLRPPISYYADGSTGCGSCRTQTSKIIIGKIKILENIGTMLKFPCRFKTFGCKSIILWAEAKIHESECRFRQFTCPACCTSEKWRGNAADMKSHVRSVHQRLLHYSVCYFSFGQIKESCFFESLGELYVLLYNCDTDSGLLWYTLKAIGPLEHAKRRHFKLTLKMRNAKYYERKQVESAKDWDINEDTAIKIDLPVLRIKLQLKNENKVRLLIHIFSRTPLYNGSVDEDLLKDTECPVCQDFMNAPIYQCNTGHSFCNYCKPKLKSCPTCRAEMSESRNFALESVCSKMYYKCMYADDGCSFASLPKDITDHEINCDFGFFDCPVKAFITDCTWRGKLDQMSSHALEEHGLKF